MCLRVVFVFVCWAASKWLDAHSVLTRFCFWVGGSPCGDGGTDNGVSSVMCTVLLSWNLLFRPFSPARGQVIGAHRRVGGVRGQHVQPLRRGIVIRKHFSADTRTIQTRLPCTGDLFNPQRITRKKTTACTFQLDSWSFLLTVML